MSDEVNPAKILQLDTDDFEPSMALGIMPSGHPPDPLLRFAIPAHNDIVRSVAVNPFFTDKFASGSRDGTVKTWSSVANSVPQETHDYKGHADGVTCVNWHPDGLIVTSVSHDSSIRFWELSKCRQVIDNKSPCNTCDFSLDGNSLAVSGFRNINIYDVETGQLMQTLAQAHMLSIYCCTYHPASVSLLMSVGDDKTVKLWDIDSGKCVQIYQDHYGWVNRAVFSETGQLFASVGQDGVAKVYYLGENRPLYSFDDALGPLLAAGINDDVIYTGGRDTKIRLYNAHTGQLQRTMHGHLGCVQDMSYNTMSKYLVSAGSDKHVLLWKMGKFLNDVSSVDAPNKDGLDSSRRSSARVREGAGAKSTGSVFGLSRANLSGSLGSATMGRMVRSGTGGELCVKICLAVNLSSLMDAERDEDAQHSGKLSVRGTGDPYFRITLGSTSVDTRCEAHPERPNWTEPILFRGLLGDWQASSDVEVALLDDWDETGKEIASGSFPLGVCAFKDDQRVTVDVSLSDDAFLELELWIPQS